MKRLTGAERDPISVLKEKSSRMLLHIKLKPPHISARHCSVIFDMWLDHSFFEIYCCMLQGHRIVIDNDLCHRASAYEHLVVCQFNLLTIWLDKLVISIAFKGVLNDRISLIKCIYFNTAISIHVLLRLVLWLWLLH